MSLLWFERILHLLSKIVSYWLLIEQKEIDPLEIMTQIWEICDIYGRMWEFGSKKRNGQSLSVTFGRSILFGRVHSNCIHSIFQHYSDDWKHETESVEMNAFGLKVKNLNEDGQLIKDYFSLFGIHWEGSKFFTFHWNFCWEELWNLQHYKLLLHFRWKN